MVYNHTVLLMTILFLKGTYTLFAGGGWLLADRMAEPQLELWNHRERET